MWAHEYKTNEEKQAPDEQSLREAMREYFEIKAQEEQNKKRMAQLREIITSYMDTKHLERVFDENTGHITRSVQEKEVYDVDAIRPILEKEQKWEAVLKPDPKEIERVIPTLSAKAQQEAAAYKQKKQTTTLRHNKKQSEDSESQET